MLSFSKSLSSKCTMEMTVHVSQGCWLRKCMRMVLVHNSWWWIRALRWDSHPLSSLHLCCSSYAHTFILRPGWLGSKRPHLPAPSWLGSFQVQRQFLVLWFFFFTVHHTRGTADEWQNYKFGEETKIKTGAFSQWLSWSYVTYLRSSEFCFPNEIPFRLPSYFLVCWCYKILTVPTEQLLKINKHFLLEDKQGLY